MTQDFEALSHSMVEDQLKAAGIESEAVLDAMRNVPRHLFVPGHLRACAYDDSPLPIGWGQTISQPYIVAYMTERLQPVPGMKVLEIGTGSGYQAAILAYLGCEVYTVEWVECLAAEAKRTFATLGWGKIISRCGNGYAGWPEEAPFDAIIVTAAPESIPGKLIAQLKEGGRMIVPIGRAGAAQWLKLIVKRGKTTAETTLLPVRFVPMVK